MKKLAMTKKVLVGIVLFISSIVILGCGSSDSTNDQKEKVIVGTTCEIPKWTEQGTGSGVDQVSGYEGDVMREIAKRNNWDLQWRIADNGGLWGMLDNDSIDTIACDVSFSKERNQKYYFAEPHAIDDYVLLLHKGIGIQTKGVEALRGKRIGCVATFNSRFVIEDKNKEQNLGMDLAFLDNVAAVVASVGSGSCDGAFVAKTTASVAMKELNMDLEIYSPNWIGLKIAYPFKKTEKGERLRDETNKALESMKKDGTLGQLSEKWFGIDVTKEDLNK